MKCVWEGELIKYLGTKKVDCGIFYKSLSLFQVLLLLQSCMQWVGLNDGPAAELYLWVSDVVERRGLLPTVVKLKGMETYWH